MDWERAIWISERTLRFSLLGYLLVISVPHTAAIQSSFLVLSIICAIIQGIARKKIPLRKTSLDWAILIFTCIAFLKTLTSIDINYSLEIFFDEHLRYVIVFYLIVANIRSPKYIQRLHYVLLLSLTIVSLFGIFGYLNGDLIRDQRATSYFSNYGRAAFYVSMIFPIALGHFLSSRRFWRNLFLGGIMLIAIGFMLITFSRGAWISTLLCIFLISSLKDRRMLLILVIVIIIVPWFLPANILERALTLTEIDQFEQSNSFGDRYWLWLSAVDMIKDRPFLGAGFGNRIFNRRYPEFIYPQSSGIVFENAHNLYLQFMVELGIVGLLSFLFILGKIFYLGIRTYLTSQNSIIQGQLLGMIGSFIVFTVFSLTTIRYENEIGYLFWYLAAGIISLSLERQSKYSMTKHS